MKVTTNIKKLDLIKFNLSLLPRMRSTYVTILIIACLTFLFITLNKGLPNSPSKLTIHLASSAIGGISGMLLGVAFNMIMILLMSSKNNGILGKHTYTLLPEGLHEETIANEGLNKWHGVISIKPAGSYLLIQIAACLFHIIPKKSFDSSEQFEEFTSQAISFWQQAQGSTNA